MRPLKRGPEAARQAPRVLPSERLGYAPRILLAPRIPLAPYPDPIQAAGDALAAGGLLGAEQLADMGGRFQRYLAAIKHNGAIDKAQAGFVALAGRRALRPAAIAPAPATHGHSTNHRILDTFVETRVVGAARLPWSQADARTKQHAVVEYLCVALTAAPTPSLVS
jgi:hypothetical protein